VIRQLKGSRSAGNCIFTTFQLPYHCTLTALLLPFNCFIFQGPSARAARRSLCRCIFCCHPDRSRGICCWVPHVRAANVGSFALCANLALFNPTQPLFRTTTAVIQFNHRRHSIQPPPSFNSTTAVILSSIIAQNPCICFCLSSRPSASREWRDLRLPLLSFRTQRGGICFRPFAIFFQTGKSPRRRSQKTHPPDYRTCSESNPAIVESQSARSG